MVSNKIHESFAWEKFLLNLVLRQKYTLPLYSKIVRSLKVKEVHLFCPDLYGLTFVFY